MAFFKHKAEFFDIPEDVLLYEIYPFLNYEERINFNQILPRTIKGKTKLKNIFKFDSDVQECNILLSKFLSLPPLPYGKEKLFYLTKFMFRIQNSSILQHEIFKKNIIKLCNKFLNEPFPLTPTIRRLINNLIQKNNVINTL